MKQRIKKYFPQLSIIAVLLVIFLLHTTYILNSFVWLDHGDIEAGRAIIPLQHLSDMFLLRYGDTGFYRPVVTFFNSLDFAFYRGFAPGYHLTNVLLHLVVTAIVPVFLSIFMALTLPETIIVMLLFGLHPLTWLPTGAISYRPELLYSLFTLLTVILHKKARVSGKQWYGFLALLAFFLALLSKETALVIVPVLIVVWELSQRKESLKKRFISAWSLLFSEGVIIALYLLLRFHAVPEVWKNAGISLSFTDALGTRFYVMDKMLMDFLIPIHIGLSDAVPITSLMSVSSAIFICFFIAFIWFVKKKGMHSFSGIFALLFVVSLAPVFNIVSLPRFGSPHYGYLPLAIFCALIIVLLRWINKKNKKYSFITTVGLVMWIGVMAITTWQGGWQFKNDKLLFTPEVKADPHFLEGYFYLGNWYLQEHLYAKAAEQYNRAMAADAHVIAYSEQRSIRTNLAAVYMMQNRLDAADALLKEAEDLPTSEGITELIHNRMILDYKRQQYEKVLVLAQDRRAVPYSPIIYAIVEDSLRHLGKVKEADNIMKTLNTHLTKDQKIQLQYTLHQLQK